MYAPSSLPCSPTVLNEWRCLLQTLENTAQKSQRTWVCWRGKIFRRHKTGPSGLFFSFFFNVSYFILFFIFFKFYFIFKLYNIVLVLSNIEMNLPQVYMCSPSWTLLPPPSPYPPSGLSQLHQPQASSIVHWTWTGNSFHTWYYTCFNVILPNLPTLSLSHRVHKTVLYISVSFAVLYTGLLLPSF